MSEISVIVPAFNVEKYINRAIDSILAQDYSNFEIIIIDDASTDNTLEIIQRHYAAHSQIHIVRHEYNQGLGAARNTGISEAKGKYLIFIDSDDWIEPNMLSLLYKTAITKNADVVACGVRLAFEDGATQKYHAYNFETCGGIKALDLLAEYKIGSIAWNKLYRKEIIDQYSLAFPPIYHEDVTFTMQLVYYCSKFVSIPDELYNYYQNSQSITKKKISQQHIYSYLEVFKLISKFAKDVELEKQDAGAETLRKLYHSQIQWVIPNIMKFYENSDPVEREKIFYEIFKLQLGDGFYFVKGLIEYLFWRIKETDPLLEITEINSQKSLLDLAKNVFNSPKKFLKYILPYGIIKYLYNKRN